MSWWDLLRDVEAQFDAADAAELAAEVADRTRREAARLALVDRLEPAVGSAVAVGVLGAGTVRGRLDGAGPDWLLVVEPPSRDVLVPFGAVGWVEGLSARSGEPALRPAVASRLGLGHALRTVARSRATVTIVLVDGSRVAGTIDRVGRDFVEVTDDGAEGHRRGARTVRAVPFRALAAVRS